LRDPALPQQVAETTATHRNDGPWASISDGKGRILFILECVRPLHAHFQGNAAVEHLFTPIPCVTTVSASIVTSSAAASASPYQDNSSDEKGGRSVAAEISNTINADTHANRQVVVVTDQEEQGGMYVVVVCFGLITLANQLPLARMVRTLCRLGSPWIMATVSHRSFVQEHGPLPLLRLTQIRPRPALWA
jgi:hypothetical protein